MPSAAAQYGSGDTPLEFDGLDAGDGAEQVEHLGKGKAGGEGDIQLHHQEILLLAGNGIADHLDMVALQSAPQGLQRGLIPDQPGGEPLRVVPDGSVYPGGWAAWVGGPVRCIARGDVFVECLDGEGRAGGREGKPF